MGHTRLGKLLTSRKWTQIVEMIELGDVSVADLATAVHEASLSDLKKASKDPAFLEALRLLCKIPLAAKEKDFSAALAELGVRVPANPTLNDVVVGFGNAIEVAQRTQGAEITDLGEMAKMAGIAVFHESAQNQMGLFDSRPEDIQSAVASFSATERFGDLMHSFMARLTQDNIQYYLDRAIPNHIGPGQYLPTIGDMGVAEKIIQTHAYEAATIVRAFAKDWYGKHAYQPDHDINHKTVQGFAWVAFEKIGKELTIRNTPDENV